MKTRFKNSFFHISIFILLVTLLYACSTKRNTFVRRAYHNLTAHYNAFWNGNESLKVGLKQISDNSTDDYYQVLPIFKYGTPQQINSINTNLDRAQEKAAKVIQKHSMRFKGKEYVKWIDDSYLLIGKAYFYKKEYVAARRTFNFIIQEYPESDLRFEAMIWLAKTYNQKGEYEKSENVLFELQTMIDDEDVPFYVKQKLPLMFAELYQLQENQILAAEYIEKGLKLNLKKQLTTRLKFILAQIYLREERYSESADLFRDVIK
ncbi:MAG: tetratricopeptide repeat protein, partial [Chlorobiales bacterium]|nr:tetratricopeptide repeat protein [Chlorobiales bacterium]